MAAIDKRILRANICQNCRFAIRQKSGYLVDCICHNGHACGNTYNLEGQCDDYEPNNNLLSLKTAAIDAIREFDKLNASPNCNKEKLMKAACRSCDLQEAYAIIVGISYDLAAELLHDEAN